MNDQKTGRDARADRLRSALRENLRRRKAQSKGKSRQRAERAIGDDSGNNNGGGADSSGSPNSAGFAADKPKG